MVDIGNMLEILQETGFYDYVLPFLLVFTILFAILEKTKVLGTQDQEKPRTNINAVLAFVIALIVIVQTDIVAIMNTYLSKMALFIIIVLIAMLVLGMLGGDFSKATGVPMFGIIIAIAAVIWALTPNLGILPYWMHLSDTSIAWLIVLGVFILIIWFVTSGSKKSENQDVKLYFKPGK